MFNIMPMKETSPEEELIVIQLKASTGADSWSLCLQNKAVALADPVLDS